MLGAPIIAGLPLRPAPISPIPARPLGGRVASRQAARPPPRAALPSREAESRAARQVAAMESTSFLDGRPQARNAGDGALSDHGSACGLSPIGPTVKRAWARISSLMLESGWIGHGPQKIKGHRVSFGPAQI